MNNNIAAVISVCLLFLSGQSHAREPNGRVTILGSGVSSCGNMTEDSKQPNGQAVYQAWINGFSTGVNLYVEGKDNFFESTDSISMYKFVLQYCEDNPLNSVTQAVAELMIKFKIPDYYNNSKERP